MEQTPTNPTWEQAMQSWARFAQQDLEREFSASPNGLEDTARRLLLDRSAHDLQRLLQTAREAVQGQSDCIDWTACSGVVNRMTQAARRRLADLDALGVLPLPVRWPPEWATCLVRDAADPGGWRTPATQPGTPRGPGDDSSTDAA